MMKNKIDRRQWLKAGMLGAGSFALSPYMALGEMSRAEVNYDLQGNAVYSPFIKEYVPNELYPAPTTIKAKLNANENPYGPSPSTLEALKDHAYTGNRYGWEKLFTLKEKIAEKEGVPAKNIMMAPGSSDLLEKTAMVLFQHGGNVVSADPSYMSLMQVAQATGATWKGVPLKKDWSHDLKGMEAAIDADTKLVYICNPNNPTGTLTDHKELYDFCSRVADKVPVFIDEAYLDFLKDGQKKSMVSLVNEGKQVMIARTFSKIHGMAGLRVGHMVASDKIIKKISAITRGGMGITFPSIYAASASMDDTEFQEKSRTLNKKAREYVYKELKSMGIEYVPSYTSFIIFPIEMDGKEFLDQMMSQGVAVRSFEIMNKTWCRVSMGTMEEMKLFASSLKEVLA